MSSSAHSDGNQPRSNRYVNLRNASTIIDHIGISPIQALISTAMLYGLTAPVIIAVVPHISNNNEVMGEYTNGKWSNMLGGLTVLLMTASAIGLLYLQING